MVVKSNETRIVLAFLKKVLDLVVQYEHERAAGTAENVGERALEEGVTTFRLVDGRPAMKSILVENLSLGTARLHHHAPTHRIEGIRDDTGNSGNDLREGGIEN